MRKIAFHMIAVAICCQVLTEDGYSSTEDFSYFTLLRPATNSLPATSLFGISCTRQMDASTLLNRPAEVTRSTVQKAVVVIADSPQFFGMLRERLSIVTGAWFAQRDFTEVEILKRFQESLKDEAERGKLGEAEEDRDQYLGMSLRQLVREFRWQTLVLFKCCLLQPKVRSCLFMDALIPICTKEGVLLDVVLRITVRTIMYDAIFAHLPDPRFASIPSGLCRSGFRQL